MDKKYLVEDYFGNIETVFETVEKGEKKTILKGYYGRVNYVNANKRRYRREVVEPQLERIKKEIFKQNDFLWGRLEHPTKEEDLMSKYENAAIGIYKLELTDENYLYGESIVLDTFYGKELKGIVEAFLKLNKTPKIGMSTRGVGSVVEVKDPEYGQIYEVNDFELITVDAVSRPSASVYTTSLAESIGDNWLKKQNGIYTPEKKEEKKVIITVSDIFKEFLEK